MLANVDGQVMKIGAGPTVLADLNGHLKGVSTCRILVQRNQMRDFGTVPVGHGTIVTRMLIKFGVEILSVRPWFGICISVE